MSAIEIIGIVGGIVAVAFCTWLAPRRYHLQRAAARRRTPRARDVDTRTGEADYEALKTRWLKEHGNKHAAHHVTELKPHPTEEV